VNRAGLDVQIEAVQDREAAVGLRDRVKLEEAAQ
jgi:hypothetical protein